MDRNIRKKLQKIYTHMKERCYDVNDRRYKDWGGRGIDICQEWRDNPELFIEWSISHGYEPGLSIDRIDNEKGYSPQNCRWVTLAENNQNRRSSRFYTLNGKTQNLEQWCREFNISRSMVNKRLIMGWDFEKAITTPKRERDTHSLIGKKFGRLTVIDFSHVGKYRQSFYKCLCDCGNETITTESKLKTGHTLSCGCIRQEMYKNMKQRYEQPK